MDQETLNQIFSIYQARGAKSIVQKDDGSIVIGWTDSAFGVLSASEVQAALASINDMDYQDLRRPNYPSIGDQLDALWKGGQAQTDMEAQIMAVKTRYPKP